MKLKEGFITHNSDDENILISTVDNGFSGLVRLNKTAAFIVEKLKSETTAKEIAKAMTEEYEVDAETALKAVETTVNRLAEIGAVEK